MIDINITKALHHTNGQIVLDIDLHIATGKLTTLYGRSGAGKTSILNMLSGLMTPDSGTIRAGDKLWFDYGKNINLSPQKRNVGFVFQDYALFPNMSVEKNLTFALAKGEDKTIVSELIDLMELGDLRDQKPTLLSGGQQQRVALARALVQRPHLLLLDEPLSAQDRELRNKLQSYILNVHNTFNLTTILVSHDVNEIVRLSDEVVVIEKGLVIEKGHPRDLFSESAETAVSRSKAKVIAVAQKEDTWFLRVVCDDQSFEIPISDEHSKLYQVGDFVTINAERII